MGNSVVVVWSFIDGSHTFVSTHTSAHRNVKTIDNEAIAETAAFTAFVEMFLPEQSAQVFIYCPFGCTCLIC
jgi:hypothetical protein